MGNISVKDNEQQKNTQKNNLIISDTLGGGRDRKIVSKFRKDRKKRRKNSKKVNSKPLNYNYLLELNDAKFDLIINNYVNTIDLLNNKITEMPPSQYRHFINNVNKYKKKLDDVKDKISEEKYIKINNIYTSILDNHTLENHTFEKKTKKHIGNKIPKIQYKTRHKKVKKNNKHRTNTSHRDKYNTKRKQYHRGKQMRRYHRFKN